LCTAGGRICVRRKDLWVAYLLRADNISGPLLIRLRRANQPVIRPRNAFSTFLPPHWLYNDLKNLISGQLSES
jgi:hypothetical protein